MAENPQIANNASLLGIHGYHPRQQRDVRDLYFDVNDFQDSIYNEYGDWEVLKDLIINVYNEIKRGGNVLVFCRQGANRSAAVIGYILTALTGRPMDEIYPIMQSLRQIIELRGNTRRSIGRTMIGEIKKYEASLWRIIARGIPTRKSMCGHCQLLVG